MLWVYGCYEILEGAVEEQVLKCTNCYGSEGSYINMWRCCGGEGCAVGVKGAMEYWKMLWIGRC